MANLTDPRNALNAAIADVENARRQASAAASHEDTDYALKAAAAADSTLDQLARARRIANELR